MRILSIREPYATLIKKKIKYIETRSSNTHYHGEIYIHSCKSKYPIKDKIKHLVDKNNLTYGYIICKATLFDSVFIDKNYSNYKNDNLELVLVNDLKEILEKNMFDNPRNRDKTKEMLEVIEYL